ncbi:MAG: hypothetical protein OHK0018_11200 [Erythrobacter tepidarius]
MPFGAALANVDLDEGAHFLGQFPRRGAFAGRQADDHRADLARLTRLQGDLFRDIVALVEQAERGDPIPHRGRAVIAGSGGRGGRGSRGGRIERNTLGLRLTRAVAGSQRQRAAEHAGQRRAKAGKPHRPPQPAVLSGVQAS